MACKMMSFDTSTTSSGWALYTNAKLTDYGTILHKEKNTTIENRMNMMIADILLLLNKVRPLIVVIERPPFKADPKTLTFLSEIIGAVRAWAILNEADYVEYTPSQWRSLVKEKEEALPTGRDNAKQWDIQKVSDIFDIQDVSDDLADAVLLGLARINEFRNWLEED